MELILTLPYPPTGNLTTRTGQGRHYTRAETLAYRRDVAALVVHYQARQNLPGPLAVTYTLTPPDDRRRDSENALKTLKDALTLAGVWTDDSNKVIPEEHIYWRPKARIGQVVVTITDCQPKSPLVC